MLPLEQVANQRPGVHVTWFGLRTTEHTLEPLRLLGATSCFLLEAPGDKARRQHEGAGPALEALFEEIHVPMQSVTTDLWDAGCVAGTIGAIADSLAALRKEPVPLHVNVSAGPRPASIGAGLASMFWDVHLFHPRGDHPDEALKEASDAVEMPSIKATLPGPVERLVLSALVQGEGHTTGPAIKRLAKGGKEQRGPGRTASAEHNEISRAIDKLEKIGAVKRPGGQHRLVVNAEPAGMALARMFEQYEATRQALRRPA